MIERTIIDSSENDSVYMLRDLIFDEVAAAAKSKKQIIILCIGTDRSTGDSLGPLVGDKLKFLNRSNISLYGTLENPVHAKNLHKTLNDIEKDAASPYIIAVDACLGNIQNVGKIIVESKPLYPGSAMNKNLPAVGNLSITGIVNICGNLEFMVLQNTRLFTVMQLANVISGGIYHSIVKAIGGRKDNTFHSTLVLENI